MVGLGSRSNDDRVTRELHILSSMAGDFTDLVAWQEAMGLVADIMGLARQVRGVGARSVVEQLVRCAESVPANIAEGYGRGLGPDYARFSRIAAASATELESHLRVAVAAGRLSAAAAEPVVQRTRRVRALTTGLARAVAGGTTRRGDGGMWRSG